MLLKLVFLSFCYLSRARPRLEVELTKLGRSVTQTEMTDSTLSEPLRLRALEDVPSFEERNWMQNFRNGMESFMRGFLNKKAREKYFTDEKRAEVIQNWRKNREKLVSVYKDSFALKTTLFELNEALMSWEMYESLLSSPSHRKLTNAFEALTRANQQIAHFKTLSVLELGGIDLPKSTSQFINVLLSQEPELHSNLMLLPPHVFDLIMKKIRSNLAEPIVNNLKDIIITKKLSFQKLLASEYPPAAFDKALIELWKQVLQSVDFLYTNHLVDQKTVRNFYGGPEMRQQLLAYTELRFNADINWNLLRGTCDFSQHWYWSLLHESFKALTKEDIHDLEIHLLLEYRFEEINQKVRTPFMQFKKIDYAKFIESFEPVKYLLKSRLLYSPEQTVTFFPRQTPKFNSQNFNELIKPDVEKIVNLIATTEIKLLSISVLDGNYFVNFLADVLEFIERDKSTRAFVEEIISGHSKYDEFDNRINLIRLSAKARDLTWKATQHHDYLLADYTPKKNASWIKKTRDQGKHFYLDPFKDLINQYHLESERLQAKLTPEPCAFNLIKLIKHDAQIIQRSLDLCRSHFDNFLR